MDTVEQTLIPLLEEHFRNAASPADATVPASATIAERLDSLELVGLVLDVEDAFGIRFPDGDLQPSTFDDVAALAAAVRRAQASR